MVHPHNNNAKIANSASFVLLKSSLVGKKLFKCRNSAGDSYQKNRLLDWLVKIIRTFELSKKLRNIYRNILWFDIDGATSKSKKIHVVDRSVEIYYKYRQNSNNTKIQTKRRQSIKRKLRGISIIKTDKYLLIYQSKVTNFVSIVFRRKSAQPRHKNKSRLALLEF